MVLDPPGCASVKWYSHPNLFFLSATAQCPQKFLSTHGSITSLGTHSSIHTCLPTGICIYSLHASPQHGSLKRDICTQSMHTDQCYTSLPIYIFTHSSIHTLYMPGHETLKTLPCTHSCTHSPPCKPYHHPLAHTVSLILLFLASPGTQAPPHPGR